MGKLNLSVAMCTYNGELYLPEQLKSIAEGNCLPYELVVCDDGSKDRTIEILNALKKKVRFLLALL
jgi:glycosyltransferase involved in cell wall biosynthesis